MSLVNVLPHSDTVVIVSVWAHLVASATMESKPDKTIVVGAVFGLGVGLGTAIGWQSACALYRTEEARKKRRAQLGMFISTYAALGLGALLVISHAVRR